MLTSLKQVIQSNVTQLKKSTLSKVYSLKAEPKAGIWVQVLYKGCALQGKTSKGPREAEYRSRKSGDRMSSQGTSSLGLIHQTSKHTLYGSVCLT